MSCVLISFGSNLVGPWGAPLRTFQAAIRELKQIGLEIKRVSSLYETEPLGGNWQPPYLNALVLAKTREAPATLLRRLKQVEMKAGRRSRAKWSPRPLDLDILDFEGQHYGRPAAKRERGRLILPHPELHKRAFVLVPLVEIAPHWQHPVLGIKASVLLAGLGSQRRGVRRILDSRWHSCEKGRS